MGGGGWYAAGGRPLVASPSVALQASDARRAPPPPSTRSSPPQQSIGPPSGRTTDVHGPDLGQAGQVPPCCTQLRRSASVTATGSARPGRYPRGCRASTPSIAATTWPTARDRVCASSSGSARTTVPSREGSRRRPCARSPRRSAPRPCPAPARSGCRRHDDHRGPVAGGQRVERRLVAGHDRGWGRGRDVGEVAQAARPARSPSPAPGPRTAGPPGARLQPGRRLAVGQLDRHDEDGIRAAGGARGCRRWPAGLHLRRRSRAFSVAR